MLADNTRTRERSQLGDTSALRVLPWKLDDLGPLAPVAETITLVEEPDRS
jgi:hypothetical protein